MTEKRLTPAAKAQKRWLKRIGRGGRAILAAIGYARQSIRLCRAPPRRRPEGSEPFAIRKCKASATAQMTKAWVIYKRARRERVLDRRRGRFVAFRLEDLKLPARVLRKFGL